MQVSATYLKNTVNKIAKIHNFILLTKKKIPVSFFQLNRFY